MIRLSALCLLFALVGCDDAAQTETDLDGSADASVTAHLDGTTPDAGPLDAGPDATISDAALVDAHQPDAEADAGPVPGDETFARAHLLRVEIEIDVADWRALRHQERERLGLPGCMDQPFASPYTWFTAQITVDGQAYEQVGIRKKGFFGSASTTRPSLKLKFDKHIDDQLYDGLERLTLNNSRQDPTRMRTCLAYDTFAKAGVPAPRCNFARVFVNGVDQGIYTRVEPIKKRFLRAHFDDDDGTLYEGTLSDFRPGWTGTIEQKNDEDTPRFDKINALTQAAMLPDDQLLDGLAEIIDLPAFIRFWATEVLVAHWDGYAGDTNNFFFYDDPTSDQIHFIPWGPDATFAPPYLLFEREIAPDSVLASGILARRLYDHVEGRRRYRAELGRQLDEVWHAPALLEHMNAISAMIRPHVLDPAAFDETFAETARWISAHGDRVARELAIGGFWDYPLRGPICPGLDEVIFGEASGTFSTRWGTWPTNDAFSTGGATVHFSLDDTPWPLLNAGAAMGIEGDGALLVVPFLNAEQQVYYFTFPMPFGAVRPGEIEINQSRCNMGRVSQGRAQPWGLCPEGRLIFDAASTAPNAPIQGRFELQVIAPIAE
jgi:hypothetical protein